MMAKSANSLTPRGYLRLSELVRQTVETIHGPWAVAEPIERVEKRVSFQGENIIFEYVSRDGMPEMPLETERERWSSARAHIHQALRRGELISFTQSAAGKATQINAAFWEASKCGEVLEFGNIVPGKMELDSWPVLVERHNADVFLEHIGHVERDGIRPEFFEAYDWTALQTVAWIYTRDRDLICQLSPMRETFGWRLCDYRVPGHDEIKTGQVDNGPPTGADFVMMTLGAEQHSYSTMEDAEAALINACRTGKIKGFGLENGAGEPKEIPAIHWSKIKFTWSDRPRDETRPDRAGSWAHPTFERKAILALWPEITSAADAGAQDALTAERLRADTLRVKEVINISRGAAPKSQINSDELSAEWQSRYDSLVDAIRTGQLTAAQVGDEPRFWVLQVKPLADFAASRGGYWQWLRDFCARWKTATQTATEIKRISPDKLRQAYSERVKTWPEDSPPPTQTDDRAWAAGLGASRNRIDALRGELAPSNWHYKPGQSKADKPSKNGG